MTDDKAARLAAIRAANATKVPSQPPAPVSQQRAELVTADYMDMAPATSLQTLLPTLLAVALGAIAAAVALPAWLPGLTTSLLGPEPKAYWYLARGSAFVAYALLWLATVLGVMMTSKAARLWPGGPAAFDLHQHASLLSLGFTLFHALILLGDRYIQASLAQALVPFAYAGYRPLWVGLGQIGLYLLALVGLSFYAKPWIGRSAWRAIHFLSFALFFVALLHGVFSGSDSAEPWAQWLYWSTGGGVVFLTCYRVLVSLIQRPARVAQPA